MRSRSPTGHWMSSSCVAASRRPMLVGSGVSMRTRRTCETRRMPLAQWQALRVQAFKDQGMSFDVLQARQKSMASCNLTANLDWQAVKAKSRTSDGDEDSEECEYDAHAYMATLEVLVWLTHERGTGAPSCTCLGATDATVHASLVRPLS